MIAFVIFAHWLETSSVAKTLEGLAFTFALFACVMLHEFGHALMAARYGIKTRDITLLPIGGVARLERMPDEPLPELWVALAGPAVNVVIAAALFAGLHFTSALAPLAQLTVAGGPFLERLMIVNIGLVLFNMLPAFPMDGGRVLRALLARKMDYAGATRIAAGVGQGMALVFGLLGFLFNPFLLFIALFVWIGASQEASEAEMRSSFAGIPVASAMLVNFDTLTPADRLSVATEKVLAGAQQDFPVVDGNRVVGILTGRRLIVELAKRGPDTAVAAAMKTDIVIVEPGERLEEAFRRLNGCECHTLPVVRDGTLVGLLTMDNVGEFVAIHAAMKTAGRGGQHSPNIKV